MKAAITALIGMTAYVAFIAYLVSARMGNRLVWPDDWLLPFAGMALSVGVAAGCGAAAMKSKDPVAAFLGRTTLILTVIPLLIGAILLTLSIAIWG